MQNPTSEDIIKSEPNSDLVEQACSNKISELQENSDVVIDGNESEEAQKFATQCKKCKREWTYNDPNEYISKLFYHECSKDISELQKNVEPVCKRKMQIQVTEKSKRDVHIAIFDFCIKDIRSVKSLEDAGFMNLAQTLISFGASYGNVDAEKLIHYSSISSILTKVAEYCRLYPFLNEIKQAMSKLCCSASVDMWTDFNKKISYISMTVHYIDKDWSLAHKVLFISHFHEERKSGENIKKEITQKFSKLGIEDELVRELTFITDQEPNIVEAFENYERHDCYSHIINTIIFQTFDEDYLERKIPEIQEVILQSKALATFLKENELEKKLGHTIRYEIKGKWDSKLAMLKSILDQYSNIKDLLKKIKNLKHLENISKHNLEELVEFLTPFKDAKDDLESENFPTLHLVLLHRTKLLDHLKASEDDSISLKILKRRAEKFLVDKYHVMDIHKISLFLCPEFRQLRMLTSTDRDKVIASIHKLIDDFSKYDEPYVEKICSAPKRLKTSEFDKWKDIQHKEKSSSSDSALSCQEIYRYRNYKISDKVSALEFWKTHESMFPRLAWMAKKYLNIPASSSWSQKNIGSEGITLAERCTNLKEDNVDDLLFLRSFWKYYGNKPTIPSSSGELMPRDDDDDSGDKKEKKILPLKFNVVQ